MPCKSLSYLISSWSRAAMAKRSCMVFVCARWLTAWSGKIGASEDADGNVDWRPLSVEDVASLAKVADTIHPSLPERDEVFAERIELFPKGCLALVEEGSTELCGYAISFPIRHRQPPACDTLLSELAPDADSYYIHDVAILPKYQGSGLARECISRLLDVAKKFQVTGLVSVYGTAQFWSKFGFQAADMDDVLKKKLLDYGDDALYLERTNLGFGEGKG